MEQNTTEQPNFNDEIVESILEKFDVSLCGFIPDRPLERLPEYFSPWEQVCDELPKLWKNGTTRSVIEKLPLLDHGLLTTEKEWYRAHTLLVFLSHSYVWCQGERAASKILPKVIAVPFFAVSRHLDMCPALNQFSTINNNWKKIDPERPLSIHNLEIINTFTGTRTEDGFYITTIEVELEFGKRGAVILVDGQQAVSAQDVDKLIILLESLHQIICNMSHALRHIHDVCDTREFYFDLKPFLSGWNEGSVLTEGLIYEGVSTKPIKLHGGSSAQSSVFHAIDEFLGIKHGSKTGKKSFSDEMRKSMPRKHRAFIEAIASGPSVKEFGYCATLSFCRAGEDKTKAFYDWATTVLQKDNDILTNKYNACVNALVNFRNIHLQIAARYVVVQANKAKPTDEIPDKRVAKINVAGSGVMPLLKSLRNDTKAAKFPRDLNKNT